MPLGEPAWKASPGGHAEGSSASASLLHRLERTVDAERGRWFLWLPVFFGCGIALYLSLHSEPSVFLALAAITLATALRIFFRKTALQLIVSSSLLMMALGFAVIKLHVLLLDTTTLERQLRFTYVNGWVERVEIRENRARLTLRVSSIERISTEDMPRRVRISVRGKGKIPNVGDAVRIRATLMPPPEPALPGGFDFARYFWFQGIGASGYAVGAFKIPKNAAAPPWPVRIRAHIDGVRFQIADRVAAVLSGDRAAVAKALLIGEKGEISSPARQALRDAGLAHIIAISGFHMALTAGAMFWLIRALLGAFPAIALRYPIKSWAAIGALSIASVYLALSGTAVTAIRAYIMVMIIFGAIILHRPAISLRNLAIAAFIILLLMPQSLVDAGFQMSFAATAVLIAFYESRPSANLFAGWPALIALPFIFLTDIASTTILASFAVDPFSAYHFHRIALYSVIGNIVAVPVVGFLIMPMVLLTFVAFPFGLEAYPLIIMDIGIRWLLEVASFTAHLPGASIAVPAFAPFALPLIVLGGLWLLIWRGLWRWFGLAVIGIGLAIAPFGLRGDIWVDRNGKLVAIRDHHGDIATPKTRKAKFSLERWMEADGDIRPSKEARNSKAFQCDQASCIAMVKGKLVSQISHPSALADDCHRAAILIASFPLPEHCDKPRLLIDSRSLRRSGAHMIAISNENLIIRRVNDERGNRPWVINIPEKQAIRPTEK